MPEFGEAGLNAARAGVNAIFTTPGPRGGMEHDDTAGKTMFFTVALKDRTSDLLVREVDTLRHIVRQTLRIRPFQIDAWVVLPNHMHCVWTLPAGSTDHVHRWRMIKGRFGNTVALKEHDFTHERRYGLFSRKLREHVITEQSDWENLVRYCWDDPVKHGLVEHARDWPYSSFHRDNAAATGRQISRIAS